MNVTLSAGCNNLAHSTTCEMVFDASGNSTLAACVAPGTYTWFCPVQAIDSHLHAADAYIQCKVCEAMFEDMDERTGDYAGMLKFGPNILNGTVDESMLSNYIVLPMDDCGHIPKDATVLAVVPKGSPTIHNCCEHEKYEAELTMPAFAYSKIVIVPAGADYNMDHLDDGFVIDLVDLTTTTTTSQTTMTVTTTSTMTDTMTSMTSTATSATMTTSETTTTVAGSAQTVTVITLQLTLTVDDAASVTELFQNTTVQENLKADIGTSLGVDPQFIELILSRRLTALRQLQGESLIISFRIIVLDATKAAEVETSASGISAEDYTTTVATQLQSAGYNGSVSVLSASATSAEETFTVPDEWVTTTQTTSADLNSGGTGDAGRLEVSCLVATLLVLVSAAKLA